MPPKPFLISKEWTIPGHQHVRVRLTERPGINLYTSLEILDGTWGIVQNSARGHGLNYGEAEARVDRLLGDGEGGWRRWVK